MSQQNTPGNDPNNGRDESQSPYGAQGAADAPSNPYFGTAQAGRRRIWTRPRRSCARPKSSG